MHFTCSGRSDGKGDGVTTATTGGGSGSEMFVVFHVEKSLWRGESGEGWGLVGGLEEGVEYMFSVVAVVMVGGEVRLQGEKTQPITAALEDTKGARVSERVSTVCVCVCVCVCGWLRCMGNTTIMY